MELVRRLIAGEDGNDAIEYALIAALIAVVIIGTVTAVGGAIDNVFAKVATALALN